MIMFTVFGASHQPKKKKKKNTVKDCKVNVQSGALNWASQTFSDLHLSNERQDQIAANEISVSPPIISRTVLRGC